MSSLKVRNTISNILQTIIDRIHADRLQDDRNADDEDDTYYIRLRYSEKNTDLEEVVS